MFFGGEIYINGELKIFDPLKIANIKIGKCYSSEWFGRFPSLSFDFNSLQTARTEEKLIELLMLMVNKEFENH